MSNVPSDLPGIEAAAADAGATATSPPATTANPGESRRDVVRRLSLDAFLPYRLRNLAQTVSASFAAVYSPAYGITPPEWRIIATVCEFQRTTATEVRQTTVETGLGEVRLDAERPVVGGNRVIEVQKRLQHVAAIVVGRRVVRAKAKRPVERR